MRNSQLKLMNLARLQGGFFTLKQAEECGHNVTNSDKFIKRGIWERVQDTRGIYRMIGLDVDQSLQSKWFAFLWSSGADGVPQGVIAHESALDLFELSDLMPDGIHLAVPPAFRRRVAPPPGVVLHKLDLDQSDVTEVDGGLRVMRPLVVIRELIREGRVSYEHIERAFVDGIESGKISATEMTRLPRFTESEKRIVTPWIGKLKEGDT